MKMKRIVCMVVALVFLMVSVGSVAFAASSPVVPNYPWVGETVTTPEEPELTDVEKEALEVKAAYDELTLKTFKTRSKLSKGNVKLTWSIPADTPVDGYVIYRSTSRHSGFKRIKTISKASTKSYTDKAVKKGKRYYYYVKAYKVVDGKRIYSGKAAKAIRKVK